MHPYQQQTEEQPDDGRPFGWLPARNRVEYVKKLTELLLLLLALPWLFRQLRRNPGRAAAASSAI